MSKILTDELIEQTMSDQGWLPPNEADQDWQKKTVLDHYEVKFTDRFDNNCEYYIYGESTRDGYEVYVASDSVRNVCISEDVYYYDSDLHDALVDAIQDELSPIYLDDEDADFVDYAIEELYNDLYNQNYEETELELQDKGYKYADEEE